MCTSLPPFLYPSYRYGVFYRSPFFSGPCHGLLAKINADQLQRSSMSLAESSKRGTPALRPPLGPLDHSQQDHLEVVIVSRWLLRLALAREVTMHLGDVAPSLLADSVDALLPHAAVDALLPLAVDALAHHHTVDALARHHVGTDHHLVIATTRGVGSYGKRP